MIFMNVSCMSDKLFRFTIATCVTSLVQIRGQARQDHMMWRSRNALREVLPARGMRRAAGARDCNRSAAWRVRSLDPVSHGAHRPRW